MFGGDALCVFFSLIPDDLLLSFMMVESVVSVVCVCVYPAFVRNGWCRFVWLESFAI